MNLNLTASSDAEATHVPDAVSEGAAAVGAGAGPFEAVQRPLRSALEARGFSELTSIQRAVLEARVDDRDLQISSQTGSGKTVALGLVLGPRLAAERRGNGPEALIIVPTRELAAQVCAELSWLFAELPNVGVTSVTGGTPVFRDRQILKSRPRVLVGTPGRLLDHVTSGALDLGNVNELVLDEADQMLDMGFREELEGILDKTPPMRRTHMVSATFPSGIQRLAERYQSDPVAIAGTQLGEANGDIEHEGHFVHSGERYAALVNKLLQADGERTLVFVQRRAEALELAERLESDGFAALPLSGELVQSQRVRTLAAFRSGRATVLVATDVAARGLDVPDVTMVIHTSPPMDAQIYTHRSGRTGRAGSRGRSVLFAPPNRRRKMARLLSEAGVDLRWRPVPDAAEVRAQLAARARAVVQAEIDETLAAGTSEAQRAHAAELLEEREPVALVAALLARLDGGSTAQSQGVVVPTESADDRRRPRPHSSRPDGGRGRPGPSGRPGSFGRAQQGEMVRFFMNWGLNQGASPGRLLAAACRRGEVSGTDIGSIAIHPNASTFDVRAEVAERFERLAGRRDPRDSRTVIRRDRGPRPGR